MKPSQKELYRWANQIPKELWEDLNNRSPRQAAETVGAEWDGHRFKIFLLGVQYAVDPVGRRIERVDEDDLQVSYQTGVVLLTTLSISKGVPPSGRMTVPKELPGGRMFFTGAHDVATGKLIDYLEKYPDQFIENALRLGGEMLEGADIAVKLPGLPYVPLYALFWRGDQESSSRAVIGIDDRVHFHLDLAGVFALTNIFVSRLCKSPEQD